MAEAPLSDLTDHLAEAAKAHEADLEALAGLDDDQIGYLARVGELEDPLTDGIDCGDHGL